MRKLIATTIVLPALLGPAVGAPVNLAGGRVPSSEIGSVNLVFGGSHSEKIVSYQTALPPGAIGQWDCSKALGDRAKAFERAARRANPTIADWRLLGVQCNAANDHWVKIVQRVPVTGAAANEE
jgi:hypothetical protein